MRGSGGRWLRFDTSVGRTQQTHASGAFRPREALRQRPPLPRRAPTARSLDRAAPDSIREARVEIDRGARERGRDPRAITITAMIGAPPGMEAPALDMLPGREVTVAYQEAGADRLSLPTLGRDETLRHLDRVVAARA